MNNYNYNIRQNSIPVIAPSIQLNSPAKSLQSLGLQYFGKRVSISEILGKPITIVGFSIEKTKVNNESIKIFFTINNNFYFLFTGSKIILSLLLKAQNNFPISATIYKSGQSYAIL